MEKNVVLMGVAAFYLGMVCPAQAFSTKTAKACNDELRARRAELARSGESLREFVNDCWWHSKPGTPTPIYDRRHEGEPSLVPRPDDDTTTIVRRASPKGSSGPAASRLARHRLPAGVRPARSTNRIEVATSPAKRRAARWAAQSATPRATRRATRSRRLFALRSAPHRREPAAMAGLFNARRAWVRTMLFPQRQPAVVLNSDPAASRGMMMRCWGQPVMFWNRRDGVRWRDATVCQTEEKYTRRVDGWQVADRLRFIAYR